MKKINCVLFLVSLVNNSMFAMSIWEACSQDNVEQVKRMVDFSSKVLVWRDHHGCLPIHYAANTASINVLDFILKIIPRLINKSDSQGNTPLMHVAMGLGCRQYIDHLKKKMNYEIDEKEQLHTYQTYKEALTLLVLSGARLNKCNYNGDTLDTISNMDEEYISFVKSVAKNKGYKFLAQQEESV